jgi:site-specific recombinase XerD
MGYMEGTSKALHTIKNYRLDILSFQKFLNFEMTSSGAQPVALENVTHEDLERYHLWLKSQGLKNNTRRRKLLTVQKFINYLARRKKMPVESARKYPTPHKIERIPAVVPMKKLLPVIEALSTETLLDLRNKVILWTLAETGCLVSELSKLKLENWSPGWVEFKGKAERKLPVSAELFAAVEELKNRMQATQSQRDKNSAWLFHGFNKFGSLGTAITPRGVEILVKHYADRLGFPDLTPRTFRHSVVMKWYDEGLRQKEIQEMLGLKTAYAFRVYEVMLKAKLRSTTEATYT